ncbi:MAG: hypothetical protein A2079_06950 [Geobacteraceae bacterium GWC2_48_7]|nr:MAG: hypothetical protein A2079_06950 [Geobacteraceae bacterium GWC2_48_7]
MALWFVIPTKVTLSKVVSRAATLMAIETHFLTMALAAVVTGLTCQNTVPTNKIGVMIRCDPFGFMAGVTLFNRHIAKFCMSYLLFSIRLLLEADKPKAENS